MPFPKAQSFAHSIFRLFRTCNRERLIALEPVVLGYLRFDWTGPWSANASTTDDEYAPEDRPPLDAIDSQLVDFVKRTEQTTRGRGAVPFYRLHVVMPPTNVSNMLLVTVSVYRNG